MNSVRSIAQKLRAWEAGRPLPRYETIHHALMPPEQTLLVAFVRMAGESRPWGIAWGAADAGPRIESIPDGRMRDDVAGLAAVFAEDLLEHMRVHNWTFDPPRRSLSVASCGKYGSRTVSTLRCCTS